MGPAGLLKPSLHREQQDQDRQGRRPCIRTVVGKAGECSWTTTFANGSLVVQGPFYDHADSVLAITGGIGIWSRARGQMLQHARNADGTAFGFTFQVSRSHPGVPAFPG